MGDKSCLKLAIVDQEGTVLLPRMDTATTIIRGIIIILTTQDARIVSSLRFFEDWLRILLRFKNSIEVKSGGNDIIYSTAADDLHDDREVEVNLSKPSVATSEATKHLEKINAT